MTWVPTAKVGRTAPLEVKGKRALPEPRARTTRAPARGDITLLKVFLGVMDIKNKKFP